MKTNLVLRGRSWEYEEKKYPGAYGAADDSYRKITIDPRLKGLAKASTQLHEILHVLLPDYDESAIVRMERELANALCELNVKFKKEWLDD